MLTMKMSKEAIIGLIMLALLILFVFFLIKTIFRIIKWIIKGIWYLLTGKSKQSNLAESDDWLTRAQARQEIRFKNSLPPLTAEAQPLKKTRKERRNEKKGYSATGWKFNEETQLWEPPKNMKGYKNYKKNTWYPDGTVWNAETKRYEKPDYTSKK